MPGPGGPGPAAERALVQRLDAKLLEQHVLVAAFPDVQPEVHIVCADPARGAITFCEAGVTGGGSVDLGGERLVKLADIGSISAESGVITILGQTGQMLAQMHFDETEDHENWSRGLRAVIGMSGDADAGSAEGGEELHMLQARSRQLQIQIGSLEAVNERRDGQLNKMVKRLDGAMEMLSAVQDMNAQQRKVIDAQKVAISALQQDLGWSPGDLANAEVLSPAADTSDASPDGHAADGDEDAEDMTAESAARMMELLEKADQMQQMLQMLESRGAEMGLDEDEGGAGPSELAQSLAALMAGVGGLSGRPAAEEVEEEDDDDDDQGEPEAEDTEEVARARLSALECEKERFEGMLQASQQEHQDLLEKLSSMRNLMASLGLREDDVDGGDSGDN